MIRPILLALTCFATIPARAGDRTHALPGRAEVIAAMEQAETARLVAYLQQFPPGTATGHIVHVRRLSELICVAGDAPGRADCHFVTQSGNERIYHIAALTRDGEGWRIVEDHMVRARAGR